jgi:purine nucleosidase
LRSIIIDCDPGVDDGVALLLAFQCHAALDIRAITTVAGNVGLPLTTRNARLLRELAGRTEIPIYAGCERPLVCEPIEAGHFHGITGLGNHPIFEPRQPAQATHAVKHLIETLRTAPSRSLTLIAMGPLTNLALALRTAPDIAERIESIVLMGGARSEGGNITASAEYNVYADPHAAQTVFSAGCKLVALGLDCTHQVLTTPERIAAIRALDTGVARSAATLLEFSYQLEYNLHRGGGVPTHDPCTIAYLLRPDLFTLVPCRIDVETESRLTRGHTAVEFRLDMGTGPTIDWAVAADGPGVFALLSESLARS